jgi:microcompartment protein CcmK/EutM
MARKIEIQRAAFKALKATGEVTGTFVSWQLEQALVAEFAIDNYLSMEEIIEQVERTGTSLMVTQQVEETPEQVLAIINQALEGVEETVVLSKAAMARQIFNKEMDDAHDEERQMSRKNVIQQFLSIVGLSKPGAATYYQNCKKAHGLIGL